MIKHPGRQKSKLVRGQFTITKQQNQAIRMAGAKHGDASTVFRAIFDTFDVSTVSPERKRRGRFSSSEEAEPLERVQFRITQAQKDALDKASALQRVTTSSLVRGLLTRAFDLQPNKDPFAGVEPALKLLFGENDE